MEGYGREKYEGYSREREVELKEFTLFPEGERGKEKIEKKKDRRHIYYPERATRREGSPERSSRKNTNAFENYRDRNLNK